MNQQSNNRISIIRDEPVAASLMKLGVPTMIGMLISALYSAIDAYFVGGLGVSQMRARLWDLPTARQSSMGTMLWRRWEQLPVL